MPVNRTRIKLCGIKTVDDARFAEALGADAIGFVFHRKSPRSVDLDQALEITAALGGLTGIVALFHNAIDDEVWSVLESLPHAVPQFHGDEPAAFCEQFSRPYLKAFGMGTDAVASVDAINAYEQAAAVLLDANAPGEMGGTGECFDWAKIPEGIDKPLIIAGGLRPSNVATVIHQLRPYGVDVSSGVESERGVKSHALMQEFVDTVRDLERE